MSRPNNIGNEKPDFAGSAFRLPLGSFDLEQKRRATTMTKSVNAAAA
jgi:hypothetical protein